MSAGTPVKPSGATHAASRFGRLAGLVSHYAGKPASFLLALAAIILWAVTGPLFHFSDTWQLVVNTCTTIITFLMVFLIQNTQNRDTLALQLKLDELIVATKGAHNNLAGVEVGTQEELEAAKEQVVQRANGKGNGKKPQRRPA